MTLDLWSKSEEIMEGLYCVRLCVVMLWLVYVNI